MHIGRIRHGAAFMGIESKSQTTLDEGTASKCMDECMKREKCLIASLHISSKICYTSGNWLGYNYAYNQNNPFAIRRGNFSKHSFFLTISKY